MNSSQLLTDVREIGVHMVGVKEGIEYIKLLAAKPDEQSSVSGSYKLEGEKPHLHSLLPPPQPSYVFQHILTHMCKCRNISR